MPVDGPEVARLNPSAYDESVTFMATVSSASAGKATGTVTFLANGKSIGTGTLSNCVATRKTSALAVGTNSITAVYAGDADYKTSKSAAVSEVTDAAATTSKVASSLNPSTVGQSVTLTATVTPAAAGTEAAPTGYRGG